MEEEAAGPLFKRFVRIRNEILRELELGRAESRREFELSRAQLRTELDASRLDQRRAFSSVEAGMANDRAVTREMLLDLREGRELIVDIRQGIQANTEGLLQVLDELRRDDGQGAPAG